MVGFVLFVKLQRARQTLHGRQLFRRQEELNEVHQQAEGLQTQVFVANELHRDGHLVPQLVELDPSGREKLDLRHLLVGLAQSHVHSGGVDVGRVANFVVAVLPGLSELPVAEQAVNGVANWRRVE